MNIREFVPPVLINFAKSIKGIAHSKEYSSYSQAKDACTSDAYQNTELCNMIADKTVIHIQTLKAKPFSLNPTNVFLVAAMNQFLTVHSAKSISILDFGGACGTHYFEVRRIIPGNISIKWYVVETAQMMKSAMERKLNNYELIFVSSIDDVKSDIDFIHSSSALQYVPDPYGFLNSLIAVKAKWIFFNRMMFNENDRDFVTVQKSYLSSNGPGKLPKGYTDRVISYPHTTISFPKFNSTILKGGYREEWTFLEQSGSFQIKNEKIVGKGMLYISDK